MFNDRIADVARNLEKDRLETLLGVLYASMGLAGEAGEVANKVKKIIRDKDGVVGAFERNELADELGDVLWYVAQLAERLGFTLDDIAKINHDKLTDRARRDAIKGSGDDR